MSRESDFDEAQRRISAWQVGEKLDFSSLLELDRLPPEISELASLQSLDCRYTEITELAPLSGLTSLQLLDCSYTEITDLAPLSGLTSLQTLDCSFTQINDLAPLSGLTSLQSLDCSGTKIDNLAPLSGLTSLQSLGCRYTQINDLAPLSGLTSLQSLDCNYCTLYDISPDFVFSKTLENLQLYQTTIPTIPQEVQSKDISDNCLASLRSHFTDLGMESAELHSCKLMVIGNGRIGKTQICRRLLNQPFEANAESTHGVIISSAPVPEISPAYFNVWDFGGQDIYHGTHALFLRSRAVFLLAWSPVMEVEEYHEYGGIRFRNYPLQYWLQYIKNFGGEGSSVIIVQTHCDEPGMEQALPNDVNASLDQFDYWKVVQYSAKNNRGRAALNEALSDAYRQIEQPLIGVGRLKLIQKLEALRDEDAQCSIKNRRNRTITYEDYVQLCNQVGGIFDPLQCLYYLHHCGTVFYQEGLFGNKIILDQSWALDAIYAIFHRDNCYQVLHSTGGRFDQALLGALLWNNMGFSLEDQQLFINMMESCGICFPLYAPFDENGNEEFVAPEFLPDSPPDDLSEKWYDQEKTVAVFEYELLPSALLRHWMAKVGTEAGLSGDYWRTGFFVPERTTQSRAKIEQKMTGPWQGELHIEIQGKSSQHLLEALIKQLQEVELQIGISAQQGYRLAAGRQMVHEKEPEKTHTLDFQQPAAIRDEYYVSYAWNDDQSEQGKHREDYVDKLCEESQSRNLRILRDKTELQFGDSISRFMRRLSKGNRIYIFLSDKYLKSSNCMYELNEIWTQVRHDADELSKTVRVFTLDDANIWKVTDRLKYAKYWRDELSDLENAIRDYGWQGMGEKDTKRYRAMKHFAITIGDVLEIFADRVQARTWEDFIQYGFDE